MLGFGFAWQRIAQPVLLLQWSDIFSAKPCLPIRWRSISEPFRMVAMSSFHDAESRFLHLDLALFLHLLHLHLLRVTCCSMMLVAAHTPCPPSCCTRITVSAHPTAAGVPIVPRLSRACQLLLMILILGVTLFVSAITRFLVGCALATATRAQRRARLMPCRAPHRQSHLRTSRLMRANIRRAHIRDVTRSCRETSLIVNEITSSPILLMSRRRCAHSLRPPSPLLTICSTVQLTDNAAQSRPPPPAEIQPSRCCCGLVRNCSAAVKIDALSAAHLDLRHRFPRQPPRPACVEVLLRATSSSSVPPRLSSRAILHHGPEMTVP